jgi:regulatory protein
LGERRVKAYVNDCGLRNTEFEEGLGTAEQKQDTDDKIFARAKNVAYRLLTYRPRSRAELRQKLDEKGFNDAIIDAVLDALQRFGYVNDSQFAEQLASCRIRLHGWGKRRIEQELLKKGIERQVVIETLARIIEKDTEIDTAKKAASRKLISLRSVNRETRYRRLAGFLERRGFSFDVIKTVLRGSV